MIAITNATEVWKALEGRVVPRTFSPGYIILSFLISYVGATTSLELIHRRTAGIGAWNIYMLALSSISMGGIGVWSMHFIGNRSITFGDGDTHLEIVYSPAYTVLSFLVPIAVLFVGFGAVGPNENLSRIRISLGGTLAGLGVSTTYYLAQGAITNYDCIYNIGSVIGSVLVAVVISVGSLGVFFFFRSAWDTTWWKRALCGLVLALAVSGMNWLGALGTQYRLKENLPSTISGVPTHTTVTIIIFLSVMCCLTLLYFTLVTKRRIMKAAKRAQQIVLATLVFDLEGKILVTHEGALPSRKVTSAWIESSPEDIFSTAHPAFAWMFRTSRYWNGIDYLFPEMKRHLTNAGLRSRIRDSKVEENLMDDQGAVIENYPLVFRELFCLTAANLAKDLNQPIDRIGVLYDEIIQTGQEPQQTKRTAKKSMAVTMSSSKADDLEKEGASGPSIGQGQLLFLISSVGRREADHLIAAGYRFAQSVFVVPIMASRLQVKSQALSRRLEIMREYISDSHMLEPGIHMACFAIRAALKVGRQGFDVLARKDAKNQLPTMQVPLESLEEWQLEYLKKLDSMTVSNCVKALFKATKPKFSNPLEMEYAKVLLKTLEALKEEIDDPFFNDASLIANPVKAPCRGKDELSPPGTALLLTFRLVAPIHSRAPGKKLDFVSLTFFKMQQHVYRNSPSHAAFARKSYREFTTMLNLEPFVSEGPDFQNSSKQGSNIFGRASTPRKSEARSHGEGMDMFGNPVPKLAAPARSPARIMFWDRQNRNDKMRSENSSEKGLIDHSSQDGPDPPSEASRDVRSNGRGSEPSPRAPASIVKQGQAMEMNRLSPGQKGVALQTVQKDDAETTFVDELFKLTIQKRGF